MPKRPILTLEDHPNLREVLSVLAQLAHIGDADLPVLAARWTNKATVAAARDRALSPDSPLVLEVLAAFEAVAHLFEDDLAGADYVTVDPSVTTTALKAVRDAIAGAYAQPVLSRSEHQALMAPWWDAFPVPRAGEPDLGPHADRVKALLAALPQLTERCHDPAAQALFDGLVDQSFLDEQDRAGARQSAFQAAVLTSRRRLWALVQRSSREGLSRPCYACGVQQDAREISRVLELCVDAACALLVADAVPDEELALLTRPLARLVPTQRLG